MWNLDPLEKADAFNAAKIAMTDPNNYTKENAITTGSYPTDVSNIPPQLILGSLSDKSFSINTLSVYPNPSNSGSFTLKNNGTALDNINVVDINGRTVYSSALNNVTTDQVFDLNLVSGLYFVNITSEEASTVKKLIVK